MICKMGAFYASGHKDTMCGQTKMNLTRSNVTWTHCLHHCLSCLCCYFSLTLILSSCLFYACFPQRWIEGFRCIKAFPFKAKSIWVMWFAAINKTWGQFWKSQPTITVLWKQALSINADGHWYSDSNAVVSWAWGVLKQHVGPNYTPYIWTIKNTLTLRCYFTAE